MDTPAIQLNQQFNLNVDNKKDELDKDSRDRVADAVNAILAKMKQPQQEEIVEVEYKELEESQNTDENN